jgi:hypothetical protein
VDYYDLDSLRLLARERHELRIREGDAERLARQIRGRPPRRPRLRLPLDFSLKPRQRAGQARLEA